jgi:CHAT domain
MSVIGGYGPKGDRELPRVLRIAVRPDGPGRFACSLHEEGTGIRWEYDARMSAAAERRLIDAARVLSTWSAGSGGSPASVRGAVEGIGKQLHRSFLGERGDEYLARMRPSTVLVDVDETILSLPWELMHGTDGPFVTDLPVGRVVATRTVPARERDPMKQDREVRILAVADPTADLALAEVEVDAIKGVEGVANGYRIHVDELRGQQATLRTFRERVAATDYDIIHFAGHAKFAAARPGLSVLSFSDGQLRADDVASLPWPSPPGIVFASACESASVSRGARLVGRRRTANGLAAAFLSAGVAGYLGYLWPVSDEGAGIVASTFYRALFDEENIGLGVLEARRAAWSAGREALDLSGLSLVFYGDAGGSERRDLAMAA